MQKFVGYTCSVCGAQYSPNEVTYTCPNDGGNLDVILDFDFIKQKVEPRDLINQPNGSLWRFAPLLPVNLPPNAQRTPLGLAGGTPVFSMPKLAADLGLKEVWLKDESRNPTASFKDRASAIVVARAIEIKAKKIVTASTGNAGAALAGMAAAVQQSAVIFAPKTAPPAKVAQLLIYGAQVLLVDGSYDDAFDLSVQAAQEFGWYCRNTGYNPFTVEGKKTAAFEIWAWMQAEKITERLTIFVSVGDGNIIAGLHKGFKDLISLGWLEHMPRLIGVQAEGSAAVTNTFNAGDDLIKPVKANTLADSISVELPRDGLRAVRAARETGGTYLTVTDEQIINAIATLGQQGIFAEPAGAAAYAGLAAVKAMGEPALKSPVLVLNTGSGLKDVRAAGQAVKPAAIIEPSLQAVKKFLMK